ncbi:hypothetical protein J2T55_000199 [Methylohalomonas lacus]|uniref:Toxin-antitoxin system HicB family antitoxin n=1 Tax=Methylohalomonas lacus TaxID=398773 RepID=A0AAE3HKR1_9GAMM|nr:hypothetical protein [Methylohalomonas lacus]MCS3902207.1 hypothetical protein [Methylohalomonas lacus]
MTARKVATLNLRIDPGLKEAARIAAEREHRSVANWIEVLIRERCDTLGIPVPEQQALFTDTPDAPED